jgi:Uncharacterized alpha/beta hydrolase domain (DUF2235)
MPTRVGQLRVAPLADSRAAHCGRETQFYDKHLDNAVWYVRHAMSIDENRADFARVEWGSSKNTGLPRPDSCPDWLDQIWFD